MTQTQMWLSASEVALVVAERRKDKERQEKQARMDACEHQWRYSGEALGESAYECSLCGKTKWE